MKNTIDFYEFRKGFEDMDRDYYSNDAYEAMFDFYESIGEDTGKEIEYDVIAICGEWSEYTLEEIAENFGYECEREEDEDDDEYIQRLIREIEDNTAMIELDNGSWLVMNF